MTIVIQHKFWGLEVHQDAFEITLSFNDQGPPQYIPYAALTSFLDPSVQFGLQFGQIEEDRKTTATTELTPETEEPKEGSQAGENGVTLDQFRKD